MSKIIAKYNGYLLNANCRSNEKILLWGEQKKLLEFGFNEYKDDDPITYDKIVNKTELEELYEEHEFGTYRGIEFSINGGTEKTYTIWYWTKDDEEERMCKSLGMELYERGIYVKGVQKSEIINYRIEKEDLLNK